jgi:hypothetical protein
MKSAVLKWQAYQGDELCAVTSAKIHNSVSKKTNAGVAVAF